MKISFKNQRQDALFTLDEASFTHVYMDSFDELDASPYLCVSVDTKKAMVDLQSGIIYDGDSFAGEGARWMEVPAELIIGAGK